MSYVDKCANVAAMFDLRFRCERMDTTFCTEDEKKYNKYFVSLYKERYNGSDSLRAAHGSDVEDACKTLLQELKKDFFKNLIS